MKSIAVVTYVSFAFLARMGAGVVSPNLQPTPDSPVQQTRANESHLVEDKIASNSEDADQESVQGFWPFSSASDDDDDFEDDDGKWYTIEQRKFPDEIGIMKLVGNRGHNDYLESEDLSQNLPMPSLSLLNTTSEPGHNAFESTQNLTARARDDCSHGLPIPKCRTARFHNPYSKSCKAVLRMLDRVQSNDKMAVWPKETRSVCTDGTPLGDSPQHQCCVSWSRVKGHDVGEVALRRIQEYARLIFARCVSLTRKARSWGKIRGVQIHPRDPGCASVCMYKRPTHCHRIHR
ncbi:hypothetical protein F5Y18DRAFT_438360 [Xylariaceae sp. FL1019]|nr:hypothetical protein F5Y18DRAFT_438360 [Xylariaceae sp. FL1019]